MSVTSRASISIGDAKDKVFITLESSTSVDPTNPSTKEQRAEARATIWEETQDDLNFQLQEAMTALNEQMGKKGQ